MEEELLTKAYDSRLMGRLLSYGKPYWKWMAAAVLLMFVHSSVQIAGPLLTKIAVDRYLAPVAHRDITVIDTYLSADKWEGLSQISAFFLGAMLLGLVTQLAQSLLMMRTGQWAMFDLRRQLMAHLNRLDIAYFDRHPAGRIVTRVTTDVNALNELLSSGLVALAGDVVVLLFLLAAMIRLSPSMTLMTLGVAPFIVAAMLLFRKSVQGSNRRIRLAVARINAFLQEHITGMSVVQLFNRQQRAAREFDEGNREHMLAFKSAIFAYGWFYPVVEFLGMLTLAALLAYGGWRIEQGELTLGALIAFFQFGIRFFRPVQDMSEKYNILQAAMAAAERVFLLLDAKPAIRAAAKVTPLPEGRVPIEFDHVWFAYRGEEWVLRDVSFRIEPGETIAVVGHTGAGKTTLASLLLRFYEIQKGAIRIGGVDIREVDPEELRRHFAIVLQDPFLFTGDIASNIRLGTAEIGEADVKQAARAVNLLDFVETLPGGFSHTVRERGAGLSTGQKQLVSFARALAHNRRFLILDEATASVDTETERRIREAEETLIEGRTSLVIAHRLSTIQRATRILVMHKGELREAGSHQELLGARGLYWKLYCLQYRDQETGPIQG